MDNEELRSLFAEVDVDSRSYLTPPQSMQLMRLVGLNVSEAELHPYYDTSGSFTLASFLRFMESNSKGVSTRDEILRAFRVFDPENKGWLTNSEFRKAMVGYGEQFTDDEVDEIIREADREFTGGIDYYAFTDYLFAGLESHNQYK